VRKLQTSILTGIIILGLFIFGCGDDDKNPVNPGGGADETITITGNLGSSSYSPDPDTVLVGQRVSWHNGDSMTHTATSDGVGFDTNNIAAGATSAPIQMNTLGSFPYHCNIHSGMVGTLVVQ
jgi:plastocyanin